MLFMSNKSTEQDPLRKDAEAQLAHAPDTKQMLPHTEKFLREIQGCRCQLENHYFVGSRFLDFYLNGVLR